MDSMRVCNAKYSNLTILDKLNVRGDVTIGGELTLKRRKLDPEPLVSLVVWSQSRQDGAFAIFDKVVCIRIIHYIRNLPVEWKPNLTINAIGALQQQIWIQHQRIKELEAKVSMLL